MNVWERWIVCSKVRAPVEISAIPQANPIFTSCSKHRHPPFSTYFSRFIFFVVKLVVFVTTAFVVLECTSFLIIANSLGGCKVPLGCPNTLKAFTNTACHAPWNIRPINPHTPTGNCLCSSVQALSTCRHLFPTDSGVRRIKRGHETPAMIYNIFEDYRK